MCGRITQKSDLTRLGLELTTMTLIDPLPPRYNGAPGQERWAIRQHPKTGERSLDRLWWGLIPYWTKEAKPKHKAIIATAERVATAPMFRAAYARRRCLLPVDNFFEWRSTRGKARQPYAVGMKSGEPFALGAIWEGWKRPGNEEWVRTFAVVTTAANGLVAQIHDRMPVIIPPIAYDRWLANVEPDPRDLLVPFPSEPMAMWPIGMRVNKPENDDAAILDQLRMAARSSARLPPAAVFWRA
jgi:putative SOS response-associated peptidase YedK